MQTWYNVFTPACRWRSTPRAVYTYAGMHMGLAAMIEASRLMTGEPTAGNGYERPAIAAGDHRRRDHPGGNGGRIAEGAG
jgi:predicted ABC-type sugar transport system permease subunit